MMVLPAKRDLCYTHHEEVCRSSGCFPLLLRVHRSEVAAECLVAHTVDGRVSPPWDIYLLPTWTLWHRPDCVSMCSIAAMSRDNRSNSYAIDCVFEACGTWIFVWSPRCAE